MLTDFQNSFAVRKKTTISQFTSPDQIALTSTQWTTLYLLHSMSTNSMSTSPVC